MAIKGLVHVNEFFGGMSDTDTRMASGQFVYSENLDIRSDPDFITLNDLSTFRFNTDGLMLTAVRETGGNVFFFGENGNIYDSSATLVHTTPAGAPITNSIIFNGRIIRAYVNGDSIELGAINSQPAGLRAGNPSLLEPYNSFALIPYRNGSSATVQAIVPPFPAGVIDGELLLDSTNGIVYVYDLALGTWSPGSKNISTTCIPMLNITDSFLVIGVENTLKIVTDSPYLNASAPGGGNVQDAVEFESRIIGLSNNGNLVKVYLETGRIYYWNIIGRFTETFQETDIQFRYVETFGAYDYIVAGFDAGNSELYLNQGLQFQGLKFAQISQGAQHVKYMLDIDNRCSENTMVQFQNIIFTSCHDNPFAIFAKRQIYSFGNKYNGYPIAHVVETTTNGNGDVMDRIGMFQKDSSSFLIYSWDANGAQGIDRIPLSQPGALTRTFTPTGQLYSQKYVLDHTELKRLYEIDVRYGNTAPGRTIEIEAALDGGAYQPLFTIDETTDVERPESKFRKVVAFDDLPDDRFFEIQFRFIFTTDDDQESPRLYDFRFKYEINES